MAKKAQKTSAKAKTKTTQPAAKPKAKGPAKASLKPAVKAAAKSSAKPVAAEKKTALKAAVKPSKSESKKSDAGSKATPKAKATAEPAAAQPVIQAPLKSVKVEAPKAAKAKPVVPAEVSGNGSATTVAAKAGGAVMKSEASPSTMSRAAEKKAKSADGPAEKKSKKSAKSLAIALDKLADLGAQWNALFERSKDLEAIPYKMSETYEPRTAIMHKVLGWGYVLSNQNNRLEVLFKDGIKILISNYKG